MDDDMERLADRARSGDISARGALLESHRERLERMVALRMDARVVRRVDPADVVQEAFIDADRKLDTWLEERPLPFYPWLRHIAWERLLKVHEQHLGARKRSVLCERLVSDRSAADLAGRLVAAGPGPRTRASERELRERVLEALEKLRPVDCEVLILRHVERLSVREVAAVTGLGESNVKVRCLRAIERVRGILGV